MLQRTLLGVFWGVILSSAWAHAEKPPILTFVEGTVELFSEPSQKIHAEVPEGMSRARYEGTHYLAQIVRPGARLPLGAWLRTRPGARARVVFANGDQMNVGPASFFKIEAPAGKGQEMDLRYGLVRSIISKKGPRSRFKVRTSSAVMGVRGTDFVVESNSLTSLTLIRGAVELRKTEKPGSKTAGSAPVKTITAGETAMVEPEKPVLKYETSQTEFKRVLASTEQRQSDRKPVELPAEVREAEAAARKVTTEDLIDHAGTAEERRKIESLIEQGVDAATLNRVAVVARIVEAPVTSPGLQLLKEQARKRSKISEEELNRLEKDPYERYFEGTQSN